MKNKRTELRDGVVVVSGKLADQVMALIGQSEVAPGGIGHARLRRADRPVAPVVVKNSVLAMFLAVRPSVDSCAAARRLVRTVALGDSRVRSCRRSAAVARVVRAAKNSQRMESRMEAAQSWEESWGGSRVGGVDAPRRDREPGSR